MPHGLTSLLVQHGVLVQLPTVSGAPLSVDESGHVLNPLTETVYKIIFIGTEEQEQTAIAVQGRQIWFDGTLWLAKDILKICLEVCATLSVDAEII